jgi:putrescine aminotransferase
VHVSSPAAREGESEGAATARLGAELSRAIESCGPERVLGVVAEPVQLWDVPVPPAGYWPELRRFCVAYDLPLVADEVITGFGRTGRWFGLDHWGVEADVVVLGKGLASGYAPISAVGVAAPICEVFDAEADRLLHHISTTSGHPLGCALALENIRILGAEGLVERAERAGELLRGLLADAFGGRPYVAEIRGIGMLNCVQLYMGVPPGPARAAANAGLRSALIGHGAYLRVDGQIWFIPPLTTSEPLLEELVQIAADAAGEWFRTRPR